MPNFKHNFAFYSIFLILSNTANASFFPSLTSQPIKTSINLVIKENSNYTSTKGQDVFFETIKTMVQTNNKNVKSFQETLSGMTSTDVSKQFEEQIQSYKFQNTMLELQASKYDESAKNLEQAAQVATDESIKTMLTAQSQSMATLAEQARLNISMNNTMISEIKDSKDEAQNKLEETITTTKKQFENMTNQIIIGAQTQYITIKTTENAISTIERNINAIKRNITAVQKQFEIGIASEIDLQNIKNQLEIMQTNLENILSQKQFLEENLSITLGNETGTKINVQSLPQITEQKINNINYNADLQTALKNSYAIWQKQDAVRQASNEFKENATSTSNNLKSAKLELEATKTQTELNFKNLYTDLTEKNRTLNQTQNNLNLAEQNFKIAEVKYEQGIISYLEYMSEKDKLENAKDEIKKSQIELFTAYNTYQWGISGVIGGQI